MPQVHWHWQQQGDRRWIDVRGWKEAELRQLIESNEGDTMWFRMRRKTEEYVSKVFQRACPCASFAQPPTHMHGCLPSLSHGCVR